MTKKEKKAGALSRPEKTKEENDKEHKNTINESTTDLGHQSGKLILMRLVDIHCPSTAYKFFPNGSVEDQIHKLYLLIYKQHLQKQILLLI
jgi:hypothetical protein